MSPEKAVEYMEKLAVIRSSDLRGGTPVYSDISEFKKKLKPGDIVLMKHTARKPHWTARLVEKVTGSRWSHVGVYTGNGKITHFYGGIHGWKAKGPSDAKIRTHEVETIPKIRREMFAVRPKVSPAERRAALKRIKAMPQDMTYSYPSWLRAGLFQKRIPKDAREELGSSATCSAVPAFAYPALQFKPRISRHHLRPEDFKRSRHVTTVAAFEKRTEK